MKFGNIALCEVFIQTYKIYDCLKNYPSIILRIYYLLGLAGLYYFFLRKKEEPAIKNYVIQPTIAATVASAGSGAPKGFIDKMKKSKRRMVVFYGSQTGTAEEFAARLAKEGTR